MLDQTKKQDLYQSLASQHGGMIARLAAAYEKNAAARQDLEQDIHLHLWRSLDVFAGQCSLITWTYRVAHNVCAQHVGQAMRRRPAQGWVDIDQVEPVDGRLTPEEATGTALTLERLYTLIDRLRPADRQVVLLYLEDIDAAGIAEITGLSAGAVATRIHRIKALLAQGFKAEVLA
ncbi:sigma-70 family RNA polymerase sigma factor [Aminobacter aganoensis]